MSPVVCHKGQYYKLFTGLATKQKNVVNFVKLQPMATYWILSSMNDYRERLTNLNLLSLSLNVGMHDLLFDLSMEQISKQNSCKPSFFHSTQKNEFDRRHISGTN